MKEVAVVVPVYKTELDASEIKSFQQCLGVLKDYPIILVCSDNLDIGFYNQLAGQDLIRISFEDRFFKSVKGYSKLLLDKSFYRKFIDFEYILIYQLDAWVFRDELSKWCAMGFDYIGAPWIEPPPLYGKKPFINLSQVMLNKVGNGGLSLRKVKSHMRWANWVSFIFRLFPKNEDLIWTLFVPFNKPITIQALAFAFEMNPEKSFELNNRQLPFGCHAWEKHHPEFWHRIAPELPMNNSIKE